MLGQDGVQPTAAEVGGIQCRGELGREIGRLDDDRPAVGQPQAAQPEDLAGRAEAGADVVGRRDGVRGEGQARLDRTVLGCNSEQVISEFARGAAWRVTFVTAGPW
jgi:hypothetical protein